MVKGNTNGVDSQLMAAQEEEQARKLREEKKKATGDGSEEGESGGDEKEDNLGHAKAMARRVAISRLKNSNALKTAKTAKKIASGVRMAWIIVGSSTFLFWFFVILAGLALFVMVIMWMEAGTWEKVKSLWGMGWGGVKVLVELFF